MLQAHITYKFKSETKNGYISFTGEKIQGRILKKEIANKSGSKQEELVLEDQQTRIKYKDDDFIKAYSVIIIERVNPSYIYAINNQNNSTLSNSNQTNNNIKSVNTVILPGRQQLESIVDKAKFFMIKSSNEVNIQRAKDQSLWATTLINQRKLKDAFEENQHVLLFFKASNSNNLQGLARMEEKPSEIPNKNVWSGVQTIKLGGNFKIKWLSKSIVAGSKYEHEINPLTKQYVSRSPDSQQIQKQLGKKIAFLFQFPTQQDIVPVNLPPQRQQKIINIDQILNSSSNTPFPPPPPPPSSMMPNPPLINQDQLFSMFNELYNKNRMLELQKQQRQKSKSTHKKQKHKKRSDSSDDDSSDQQSEEDEDSSESDKSRKKKSKKKKSKKEKRQKKSKKERSREKSKHKKHKSHKQHNK